MSTHRTHRSLAATRATHLAATTSTIGAVVFLIGTGLHPARDGDGIAAIGQLYGLTHSVQALGLMLMAIGLANLLRSSTVQELALLRPVNAALAGTLAWLGLIVFDGAHNPVTAQHAPELVHSAGSLDVGAALLAVPALILFPFGYSFLASALTRHRHPWPGLLLGLGAVTYTIGGVLIFPLGPDSALIQPLEVFGSALLAAGYLLFGRLRATPMKDPDRVRREIDAE